MNKLNISADQDEYMTGYARALANPIVILTSEQIKRLLAEGRLIDGCFNGIRAVVDDSPYCYRDPNQVFLINDPFPGSITEAVIAAEEAPKSVVIEWTRISDSELDELAHWLAFVRDYRLNNRRVSLTYSETFYDTEGNQEARELPAAIGSNQ